MQEYVAREGVRGTTRVVAGGGGARRAVGCARRQPADTNARRRTDLTLRTGAAAVHATYRRAQRAYGVRGCIALTEYARPGPWQVLHDSTPAAVVLSCACARVLGSSWHEVHARVRGVSLVPLAWQALQLVCDCGNSTSLKSVLLVAEPQYARRGPLRTLGRAAPLWMRWVIAWDSMG